MPDDVRYEPLIPVDPLPPNWPPLTPLLSISPATANVDLLGGQAVTVSLTLGRHLVDGAANLSVGALPAGLTAALSATSLPASTSSQSFSLTLTAAQGTAPVAATVEVTAISGTKSAVAKVAVNASAVGQLFPRYLVLSVVYAPPGTAAGKGASQVVYGSQSSTGTTITTSDSFTAGVTVSATAGGNFGVVNLSATDDFTASVTATDSSALTVSKASGYQIAVAGAGQDGINHGGDLIYLLLNPAIGVAIDPHGNVAWEIGTKGDTMVIQYVLVSWLQQPSTMPADVAATLSAYGLTAADYSQILGCDPFADGSTTFDTSRFLLTPNTFPYEPLAPGNPVATMTYTLTSTTTSTASVQAKVQYGMSCTVSAGIPSVITATLKASDSVTFTAEVSTTKTSVQSAGVTVGGPSATWDGSTDVAVYWDTIFDTFMFAFIPAGTVPGVAGTITASTGAPAAGEAVTLTLGGRTYNTWTDSSGNYRFYNLPPGSTGTVAAGGHLATIIVPSTAPSPQNVSPTNLTL